MPCMQRSLIYIAHSKFCEFIGMRMSAGGRYYVLTLARSPGTHQTMFNSKEAYEYEHICEEPMAERSAALSGGLHQLNDPVGLPIIFSAWTEKRRSRFYVQVNALIKRSPTFFVLRWEDHSCHPHDLLSPFSLPHIYSNSTITPGVFLPHSPSITLYLLRLLCI